MTAPAGHEYPGLETVLRLAMDRAKVGLPPDVAVGIMFAVHLGDAAGGFAWIAGFDRESAIGIVCEWLGHQIDEGKGELVLGRLEVECAKRGVKLP